MLRQNAAKIMAVGKMRILSFDIGGSKIAWAIISESGDLLTDVQKIKTPSATDEIVSFLQKIAGETKFEAVALASAGVVYNNKLHGKPNNLPSGYEKIDFAKIFGVPTAIINDANAALWAEYKIGALRNVQHGIMLTLGTDVGCGIICNGQLLQGKCGAAGEINFDFSGRSLQKLAAAHNLLPTDCFAIYKLHQQGNLTARQTYLQWEENLLNGIGFLNGVLDTEVIALSGSIAAIVDYAKINASIRLLQPHNPPQIVPARCADNAGLIGAALWYMDIITK